MLSKMSIIMLLFTLPFLALSLRLVTLFLDFLSPFFLSSDLTLIFLIKKANRAVILVIVCLLLLLLHKKRGEMPGHRLPKPRFRVQAKLSYLRKQSKTIKSPSLMSQFELNPSFSPLPLSVFRHSDNSCNTAQVHRTHIHLKCQ